MKNTSMILSTEIIIALIGVLSALSIVIIKDIIFRSLSDRRTGQRALLQLRLEKAYTPLEFLAFKVLCTDEMKTKRQLLQDIEVILRQHGHLLSERSLSSFYTFIDDTNGGALLINQGFYMECQQLKNRYYLMWHSKRDLHHKRCRIMQHSRR